MPKKTLPSNQKSTNQAKTCETINLRKNHEIHSFPINHDSEIFVNDELLQKFLIYDEKVRHDEDVDTDEEVRNLGIR